MGKELKEIKLQEKNGTGKHSKEEQESESPNAKLFWGRSPSSWAKVVIYYTCYYTTITGFLLLNYYLFSKTLSRDSPTYTLDQSLIGSTPGLSIRPQFGAVEPGDGLSSLISYHANNHSHADFLAKQVEEVLKESHQSQLPPQLIASLGNCTAQNKYGFGNDTPCVLVRLNRIYGWIPEPFGLQEGKFLSLDYLKNELEEQVEIPEELVGFIVKEVEGRKGNETEVLNNVWISCGEVVGNQGKGGKLPQSGVTYHPSRSIPFSYFPYLNQKNYQTPYIFVQFQIPRISRHTIIEIKCMAWAKNIRHEGTLAEGLGAVKFGILLN